MQASMYGVSLANAVRQTYRDRPDVVAADFPGNESQAWTLYARLLGLKPAELATAIAPTWDMGSQDNIESDDIDTEVLALVSYDFCQRNNVLPLRWHAGALEIATFRPHDFNLREQLGFIVGKPIRWVLVAPTVIEDAVLLAYSREAVQYLHSKQQSNTHSVVDENAVVRLARELMTRAVGARASDLHIQPFIGGNVVRIRVDGQLRRQTVLPEAVAGMLIRHIKVLGGMQPTDTLVPQDGRMTLVVDGHDYALRLSTLPVSGGERLVVRFLPQTQVHRLRNAGFSLAALQSLKRAVNRPAGLVVFTGPTGSGKSSSLYALLSELNRGENNILTVEDPVEYRLHGISQVEVNDKANRGFGNALRAILRQDPDVILIGEIRDQETAEIAAQAALTGHLVLTTLHTNDAMTAIPRLLGLGIAHSVLADALVMVASQRLCRKLCPHCKTPVREPLLPDERAFQEVTRNLPACRRVGCEHCAFTGFMGRLPIVDIVEMNSALRSAIGTGESQLSVLATLRSTGLKSLAASGSLRAISGETTVAELVEVVGPGFWSELAEHYGTYFPQESIEDDNPTAMEGFAVLLIGGDAALAEHLRPTLADEGLRLVQVADAEAAEELLRTDLDLIFIVGDLAEGMDLNAAVAQLRHNRSHISWARLPAAVLLPQSLAGLENAMRESGVMAGFCPKPVRADVLLEQIRRARAR